MAGETAPKRAHKATYARDKRKGGYLIRVQGPNANRFVGREVPVIRKDDTETTETLDALLWTGIDAESGTPVALYTFVPKERQSTDDSLPF